MQEFLAIFGGVFGVIIGFIIIKYYQFRVTRLERKEFLREITVGSFLYNPRDWR